LSLFEDSAKSGILQIQRIKTLTETPTPPKHLITYFYSENCPHCAKVTPQLENYIWKHPETMLIKIEATTREGTNQLEATLKGLREVPTAVVDDTFTIKGETNFLLRLTYALQLAETLQEKEQKCLLFRK